MKDCLPLLMQGIECWNQWRAKYPLRPCSLAGHDLSQGYFFEGNFRQVNLRGANLRRACLVGANLSGADLRGADLSGAYLSDADLSGADLGDADLTKAVLDRADLRGADLRGANLLGTQMLEVDLRTTKLPELAPELMPELTPELTPVISLSSSAVTQAKRTAALPVVSQSVARWRLRQQRIRLSPIPGQGSKGARKKNVRNKDAKGQWGRRQADRTLLAKLNRFLSHRLLSQKRRWVPTAAAGLALTIGLPLATNSVGSSDGLPALMSQSANSLVLAKSLTSDSRILSIATRALPNRKTQVIGGTADGNIQIWDGQTGQTVLTLGGHTGSIKSLAVSPSGNWLVSSSDKELKVWNPNLGQLIHTISVAHGKAAPAAIGSVAIAPDESTFVSSDQAGNVTVWDIRSGQERYQIASESPVWSVAIAPDSRSFVSSGQDRVIRQWDLATGAPLKAFIGHDDAIRTVAISPDGQRLASGSQDQTIKLWSLATGELQATLKGHQDQVFSLAISSDSQTLASSSSDRTLKLWDLANLQLTETLDADTHSLVTVAFAAANGPLISGGSSQQVNIWQ